MLSLWVSQFSAVFAIQCNLPIWTIGVTDLDGDLSFPFIQRCCPTGYILYIWMIYITYLEVSNYISGRWTLHIWTTATYLDGNIYARPKAPWWRLHGSLAEVAAATRSLRCYYKITITDTRRSTWDGKKLQGRRNGLRILQWHHRTPLFKTNRILL